ncbi:MAG: glycosyltransferase family 1 protein [Candidatus Cloacimonetes bacterium]|nr:glycosyltransferase family 1 protein [Candidatus Cloacimonadota bacterium]
MKITTIIDVVNPQSNGKLITAELRRQGHKVQVLSRKLSPNRIVQSIIKFCPEVVFGTHTHRAFSNDITRKIKNTPSHPLMVLWYVDGYGSTNPPDDKEFEKIKGLYDLMLVSVKGLVPELEEYAKKIVWSPQYFDNTFFKPTIKRTDAFDICFLGNVCPKTLNRLEFINVLRRKYKILVGGAELGKMFIGSIALASFYMQSKIAIDIPGSLYPRKELMISQRLYQAMGLGCLFISQQVPSIEQLFVPKIHLDVYEDNTIESLCSKIDYYLEHQDELKKIALVGQKEILDKHIISVRVKQYIQEIRKLL